MKLFPLMLFMLALQASMVLFDFGSYIGTSSATNVTLMPGGQTYSTLNISTNSSYATQGYTSTFNITNPLTGTVYFVADPSYFWNAAANPFQGSRTLLIGFLVALAVYVFGIGLFASRNEMVYLSPLFLLLLGVGFLPCYNLWQLIAREAAPYMCGVDSTGLIQPCATSGFFALLFAGPLLILWIVSCVEFWAARQLA